MISDPINPLTIVSMSQATVKQITQLLDPGRHTNFASIIENYQHTAMRPSAIRAPKILNRDLLTNFFKVAMMMDAGIARRTAATIVMTMLLFCTKAPVITKMKANLS